jgi:hypothetical protein
MIFSCARITYLGNFPTISFPTNLMNRFYRILPILYQNSDYATSTITIVPYVFIIRHTALQVFKDMYVALMVITLK